MRPAEETPNACSLSGAPLPLLDNLLMPSIRLPDPHLQIRRNNLNIRSNCLDRLVQGIVGRRLQSAVFLTIKSLIRSVVPLSLRHTD